MLSLFVHTLEHVIRIYTNLTRKESECCGEQSHHNTVRPTSKPLNGIILVSRSWRVTPVAGNEEYIRCQGKMAPRAVITCQARQGLFLLFDFWLSFSASKWWDQGNIELSEYYIKWENIGQDLPDRNKNSDPFNSNPIKGKEEVFPTQTDLLRQSGFSRKF